MKLKKVTYKIHVNLGKELHEMRSMLISQVVQICRAYGSSKKPTKAVEKALQVIDKLRYDMDTQLYLDHPDRANTYVYYPAPRTTAKKAEGQELGKRQKLPFKMHIDLGKKLFKMRNMLMNSGGQLCEAYGKTKKPYRAITRAGDAVDNLRFKMDAQLYLDYPDDFDTHVYFCGGRPYSGPHASRP